MPRSKTTGKYLPISGAALAAALALMMVLAPAASAATVVIDKLVGLAPAAAGNGWAAHPDQSGGTEEFVKGPATPPAGTGSLQVSVPAGGTRALIFTVPNPGSGATPPGNVGPINAVDGGTWPEAPTRRIPKEASNTADSVASLKFVGYQNYDAE